MRFLEIPALITEDIETPDIVDITEPITASISGTTLTIDGGNKVSGESTITLTGDVTVNTITKTNLREPFFVIGHQLNASLLVAILTSLICRNPFLNKKANQPFNSVIVGLNS